MIRKDFLQVAFFSIGTSLVSGWRSYLRKVPTAVVACLGDSGIRVSNNLLINRKNSSILPLVINSYKNLYNLFNNLKNDTTLIIVSRISHPDLWPFLWEVDGNHRLENIVAYYLCLNDKMDQHDSKDTLQKSRRLFSEVKIIPDNETILQSHLNYEWFDKKTTNAEKQVVAEILRKYK
jgi:hypothetical protein